MGFAYAQMHKLGGSTLQPLYTGTGEKRRAIMFWSSTGFDHRCSDSWIHTEHAQCASSLERIHPFLTTQAVIAYKPGILACSAGCVGG